jgi:glycosyltransferase involved in cell wall biosynthesis
MGEKLITFAVPYYSGISYLRKALQSLIDQENPHWLAIVLDDRGGEDAEETVRLCNDNRISYVRNETNLGLAGNWNKALSLATTEFVTLFHSDDELESNYTDLVLGLMDRYPKAVAGHCRTRVIGSNGKDLWSLPDEVKRIIRPKGNDDIVTQGEEGLLSLVKGSWIFCPTLCYRKSLLPSGGFSSAWKFVLDVDLTSRILFDGGAIVGTPTVGYKYRRHSTNQTSVLTESNIRFQEEIDYLNHVSMRSSEIGWKRVERSADRKVIVRLHLLYQVLRAITQLKWTRIWPLLHGAIFGYLK